MKLNEKKKDWREKIILQLQQTMDVCLILIYIYIFFQTDFVQDPGPVCHPGLYLGPGSVPEQPLLPGYVHSAQLPAGDLPVHCPLCAQQGGKLSSSHALNFKNRTFFRLTLMIGNTKKTRECCVNAFPTGQRRVHQVADLHVQQAQRRRKRRICGEGTTLIERCRLKETTSTPLMKQT